MGRSAISELLVYPRLVFRVFPIVRRILRKWKNRAARIPDAELRKQALSSITSKSFHCMGGSVLALTAPANLTDLVKAIVAIQTVSDYLDNLCDRASGTSKWALDGSVEAAREGFQTCMRLHEAFLGAVDPYRPYLPYYDLYPVDDPRGDGGYLQALVDESREVLRRLPGYGAALPGVRKLAKLYAELQAIKHLSPEIRDGLMEEWFRVRWVGDLDSEEARLPLGPMAKVPVSLKGLSPLKWWEFAAATGSTLGMFALACASADPVFGGPEAKMLLRAYFPSIAGLHILLDYYIDRDEDRVGGDLNFVERYPSVRDAEEALVRFARWAMDEAGSPAHPWLHQAVVRGLLAMYLSDPKVLSTGLADGARVLLGAGGGMAGFLRCSLGVIRKGLKF